MQEERLNTNINLNLYDHENKKNTDYHAGGTHYGRVQQVR